MPLQCARVPTLLKRRCLLQAGLQLQLQPARAADIEVARPVPPHPQNPPDSGHFRVGAGTGTWTSKSLSLGSH